MATNTKPDGYTNVTPIFVLDGAEKFIDFARNAFGASERLRMPLPDGKLAHAELMIGDSVIMVADATNEWPKATCSIHLYVDNIDETYKKALAAGAQSTMEPVNMFYGDRTGGVMDPFGNSWSLATHIEDVSDEESERRFQEWTKSMAAQ